MSSETILVQTYPCPQCRAELEAVSHDWDGWQRCPKCGLPSLPPEVLRLRGQGSLGTFTTSSDDILVIPDSPEDVGDAQLTGLISDGRPSYVSGARLIFRTGLLVSLGLAFIFFLDRRTTNTVIFGSLALIFFVLLLRTPARAHSRA